MTFKKGDINFMYRGVHELTKKKGLKTSTLLDEDGNQIQTTDGIGNQIQITDGIRTR